jgi:phenylacetate-coenzyme A ligase PaaK-like adenylate-forming protein
MWTASDAWRSGAVALDVALAAHSAPAALALRRERRLEALLAAARRAPLYRSRLGRASRRHGAAAAPATALASLPPLTKAQLMRDLAASFSEPGVVDVAALHAFTRDASRIGEPFDAARGLYVWESSGSSGEPGLFVQDAQAMAVYDALEALRRVPPAVPARWLDPWYLGERIAFVGATTGHFASAVSIERLRRLQPSGPQRLRGFSFLQPAAALAAQLQAWAPTVLAGYPTAALLLAEEQAAGRLALRLAEVWTGGETLSAAMRAAIGGRFGCPVTDAYGASEFLAMASQCRCGALHLNSDWVILESVDEHHRPVPDGVEGHTTLLTNLANHLQPLIRYELGDRVRIRAGRCACGSPLPAIDVHGRADEMLVLAGADGGTVRLPPLALTTVLEDDAGVYDFQLVQCGARHLRLTVADGQGAQALRHARSALAAYLRAQGLVGLRLESARGPASVRGRSGKMPRVVCSR